MKSIVTNLHTTIKHKEGGNLMKETLITARSCISQIRNFAKENKERARDLELFAFTEKPEEIEDLLLDLKAAIELFK